MKGIESRDYSLVTHETKGSQLEARSRVLLKSRFKQGSIEEISRLFDEMVGEALEQNPNMGIYGLFKAVEGNLPGKIPAQAQEKSIQAIASMDINTRKLGEKALLLFNAKTLFSVVDLYFMEVIDTEEDREEMMGSAIVSTLERLYSIKPHIAVSQQIHGAAKVGVLEYIAQRDNMPIALIRKPANRQLIAARIKENLVVVKDGHGSESQEALAEELSNETGISEGALLDYIKYVTLLNKNLKETANVNEDSTADEAVRNKIKDDVSEVLETLTDREKRVINLRFGLEDGVERGPEEVGIELGVRRDRIRQIEAKALRKFRHPTRSRRLRDYRDEDFGQIGYIKHTSERRREVKPDVDTNEIATYIRPYSIKWFNVPKYVKRQLVSSGIRQIGDFFSAAPSELLEGWTGNPQDLIWTVKGVLDNLGAGEDSRAESDIRLLHHITNGILYKEEKPSRLDVAARKALYRKAYGELLLFFSESTNAQNK